MYAIGLENYGGPDVLHRVELADPQPLAGQVRVKVKAAAINPVDVMVREGELSALFKSLEPPFVPGMDIAGHIDALGDDVDPALGLEQGMAVVGVVDNQGGYGGYSEYVCLPAASVIPAPPGVPLAKAASFLMNALTARNALDTLDLPAGSQLLVTGAAGAVGTFTVALAREAGLNVVAIASAQDEPYLRSMGVDHFVARGDDAAQRMRDMIPAGVDAVVDTAGLLERIAPAVRDDGTIIALRFVQPTTLERGVRLIFVNVRERVTDHASIARLGEQVKNGLLPLRVAGEFPADQAAQAHRRFDAGGLRGRLVLTFD
ncbi:NADP-dependent oxidoreductase [Oleiagrimonas sp. C23AA]|uniref:alcohol dehydrogenase catalytic domain-containing protein n=1 Tax=Oleiagrimonas sp. C23AA TaxID=2719047 RepID=UPI001422E11C|nr:NADP-dependent oxidoreductase [Oleiagrimonas sp. C23AA]NII10962.1 NADP-dependent oxidoreductase [Oleiagrimonas sp. C23AA]